VEITCQQPQPDMHCLAGWRHRLAHLKRLRNPRELRSMWEAKTQEEKVRCRLPPAAMAHWGRPCLQ
jgi:hypothetical protein